MKFCLAILSLLIFVPVANAVVRYEVQNGDLSFTYTTDSLITSDRVVDLADLDSCVSTFIPCSGIGFRSSNPGFSDGILFYGAPDNSYLLSAPSFAFGSIASFGLHVDTTGHAATLLVTDLSAPEPATWVLSVIGFGAIGATLRRRRAAVRSTPSRAAIP